MKIRKFRKKDAEGVYKLIYKSFNEFVAPDFTKKGFKKFLEKQTPESNIKRSKTRDIFIAVINNKIVGMIEGKKNNRITRLFVDKKHHKKGIARKLADKIEKLYKKKSAKKMLVRSSLYAQRFYEKRGYKKTTRLIKNKEGAVYQPMKKVLE